MIKYLMIRANTSLMSGEELLRLVNVRIGLYPPDVLDRETMENRYDRWVPYENEAGDQFSVNCASVKAIEDIDIRHTINPDTGKIVETKEYGVEVTEEWMASVKVPPAEQGFAYDQGSDQWWANEVLGWIDAGDLTGIFSPYIALQVWGNVTTSLAGEPWWSIVDWLLQLLLTYVVYTWGELCLSPLAFL